MNMTIVEIWNGWISPVMERPSKNDGRSETILVLYSKLPIFLSLKMPASNHVPSSVVE